jgi:hypothetical protein
MADKKVTAKSLLHKARIAKSALGFLSANREYLVSGELAPICSSIVAKVDSGDIMPTAGLNEIAQVVMNHIIASEIAKGETALASRNTPKVSANSNSPSKGKVATSSTKNYVATVYDGKNEIATRVNPSSGEVEDIVMSFDMGQRANEWADRRLVEGASDWRAEVVAVKLQTSNGPMTTYITRDEAFERVYAKKSGPVMHTKKPASGALSFGVKVNNYVAKFSRG